jgi:hypothetical protein
MALLLNAEGVPLASGDLGRARSSVVRVMSSSYGQANIGRELGPLAS